jgi:glycosyltransferase involved in cell wall biosynthesis
MKPNKNKVLFILKCNENYGAEQYSHVGLSTGLYNSALFMDEMLNKDHIESKMVVVTDNNDIDREVTEFKPTHVIIEALWVVPFKFDVLIKLHPNVKWVIRLHSEVPFLANEGMAMDWLGNYSKYDNIVVACNSPQTTKDIQFYLGHKNEWSKKIQKQRVIFLPNYYPQDYKSKKLDKSKDTIDVACFGAIRPLKNHLIQAMAAIKLADKISKKLNFHINFRLEQKGEPIFNNLVALFEQLENKGHKLVIHKWVPRDKFLELCSKMDIGMQISFNETFNIVAADIISQGVPLVASPEIPWASHWFATHQTNTNDIFDTLRDTYNYPCINVYINKCLLKSYTDKTRKIWVNYFK